MSSMSKSRCWRCEYNCCEPGNDCQHCGAYLNRQCQCTLYDNDINGDCEQFKEKKRVIKKYIKMICLKKKKISRNYIKSIYIQEKM